MMEHTQQSTTGQLYAQKNATIITGNVNVMIMLQCHSWIEQDQMWPVRKIGWNGS